MALMLHRLMLCALFNGAKEVTDYNCPVQFYQRDGVQTISNIPQDDKRFILIFMVNCVKGF